MSSLILGQLMLSKDGSMNCPKIVPQKYMEKLFKSPTLSKFGCAFLYIDHQYRVVHFFKHNKLPNMKQMTADDDSLAKCR